MKRLMLATALSATIVPAQSFAQIYFQEGFDSGSNPYNFDSYNDYFTDADRYFSGERVNVGGQLGYVWKTTFYDSGNDSYFGHRVRQKADWGVRNRLHWAGYVKFGDTPNSGEWITVDGYTRMGERSYELKFPDIYPDDPPGRLIGKMRSYRADGNQGMFILYTPNGQNHSPQDAGMAPLESGQWYAIEFMVEDNGANDTVKIWVNNNNESAPDYQHTGGDMVSAANWGEGMRYDHGYRNHNVGRPTDFYYDQITIADSFIGLPPVGGSGSDAAPAAPTSLRVSN